MRALLTCQDKVNPCWLVEWINPGMDCPALYADVSRFHRDHDAVVKVTGASSVRALARVFATHHSMSPEKSMPKSRLTVRCMNWAYASARIWRLELSSPHSLRLSRKVNNSQHNAVLVAQTFRGLLDWIIEFVVVRGWKVVRFPQHSEAADTAQDGHRLDLAVCHNDGFTFVVVTGDNTAGVGERHVGCHGC